MKKLLYPLTFIYKFGVFMDKILKRPESLLRPVISVGNVTWGGTGKTPIVIELVKYLKELQQKPAVLTRGYNRKKYRRASVLLSKQFPASIDLSGDEPMLIHKTTGVPVIIGADRISGAHLARGKINAGVYVLDDGFQHWRIKRNLDIVCVNALNPFGNGMLIPAGSLREPKTALKRAGIVVITNSNLVDKEKLENLIKEITQITGTRPVVAHYGNYSITSLDLTSPFAVDVDCANVHVVCALGYSEGFEQTCRARFKVSKVTKFNDHHNYTLAELESLFSGDEIVVTTAKDAVKMDAVLPEASAFRARIAVLNISVIFDEGKELWQTKIRAALV